MTATGAQKESWKGGLANVYLCDEEVCIVRGYPAGEVTFQSGILGKGYYPAPPENGHGPHLATMLAQGEECTTGSVGGYAGGVSENRPIGKATDLLLSRATGGESLVYL